MYRVQLQLLNDKLHRLNIGGLFAQPFFWLGVVIKVLCAVFFASTFLQDLFIPFVDFFYSSGFKNPYQNFYQQGAYEQFPYPALMLYILSVFPSILSFGQGVEQPFMGYIAYRIPLLLFDFIILLVLWRWVRNHSNKIKIIKYYWLSPVLIYISYVHGQLDVIPISLLFIGLYFLFKERHTAAMLFVFLAIATKLHIILVLPFIFIYLLRKRISFLEIAKALLIGTSAFIAINLPFLWSDGFWHLVFGNKEQAKVFDLAIIYAQNEALILYLVPACYLLLLVNAMLRIAYNRDILVMYFGFSFGILLFAIPPMPGWYFWLLPFLAYFYCKESAHTKLLFYTLQFAYILYFGLSKNSDYFQVVSFFHNFEYASIYSYLEIHGINSAMIESLAFTLLNAMLLANCIRIYQKGLHNYSKHSINSRPYLIGIGGDSGVGKTTLSNALEHIIQKKNTTIIRGDDMHKWERGHDKWQEFTHLNPKANHLHQEFSYLSILKQGNQISRRHYDHMHGRFTEEQDLVAKKLVIYEGLHPFYLENLRNIFDLKVYVLPDERLRTHWKVIRDHKKRGYSKEQVLEQIDKRAKDRETFILPQQQYADVTVELLPKNDLPDEVIGNADISIETYLRMRFRNLTYLDALVNELEQGGVEIKHYYSDSTEQCVEIRGHINQAVLEQVGYRCIPDLDEIGVSNPQWPSNYDGILGLFITYCIFQTERINA